MKGLINLRGSLIVVADVAMRLMGPDAGLAPDEGSIVMVEIEGKNIGLAVQDVRDVVALEVEPIDGSTKVALGQDPAVPATATDGSSAGSLCVGVGRLENEIVIVLDVAALARQVVA